MPPKRQKTIEEQYQKLSQLDHILLRPDSYVGSLETQRDSLWQYDAKKEAVFQKDTDYVPGLYKIFDEVLVNAHDNYVRDAVSQTYIRVEIDEKEGRICVQNNGQALPIEMHKEHNMYVPEMVFGYLLTSDNYDDSEKKVTGGRNGYGAKLANIFSTKFELDCADASMKKRFVQTWTNNMREKGKPNLTAHKGDSYTKVTFWPDLPRFGMKKLDKDIIGLFSRRCLDMAGTTARSLKVFLNGSQIDIRDFKDYVELYLKAEGDKAGEVIHEKPHERWEVAMTVSEGQFKQVSFVNGIATPKGGQHVNHVAEQFVEAIVKKANSKNRGGMTIKSHTVKNYLWLFVNCKIENPTFDSQTKENMTLKASKFGSKCEISDAMINKVISKTGIVDMILQWAKAKEAIDLGKAMPASAPAKGKAKRLLNIPKLEDANLAGGKDGAECTLILTEGDSAKSLAVAGLSIIGRDRFGVFPLRGKLLNVREASYDQTMKNQEIANISKILGIEPKKNYTSTKGMRYGHIMVMADQDFDGSHIKGLILNMVQHWWPSLFKIPGFMREFVTPIVKVSKKQGNEEQQFFTMREYETWKEKHNNGKGWKIKYYKGLGTSTTAEAKEYFKSIDDHKLNFECGSAGKDDELMDLAFNKKRADDRKEWINGCDDSAVIDHSLASVSYADFVEKELVQFAKYDVMRSIPCVVDGFKPVQRKIMWAAFKRNMKTDTKVAQFAGFAAEKSAYHHGEVSLQGAIVALAQNFVGSNNVNLLTPSGQFGTRLQGGKDAAASRYIYTRLEKVARLIFHPDDDALLQYNDEDGQRIEPQWYIPVVPMLLANGAEGIGTGWSTFLPNYNPRDILVNLRKYIRCEPMEDMCPWYRGYKGSIVPLVEKGEGYEIIGVIEKKSSTTLEITELPVRKWTQDYKETLQGMLPSGDDRGQIQDFKEYHTETTVHFVITVTEEQMAKLERTGLEKAFKLRSNLSTNNLVFFDRNGKINKYNNELEIIEDFAGIRLEFYHKRKAHLLRKLRQQQEILSEKVRFIRLVISEELKVKNRKKDQLIADLRKKNFRTIHEICEGEEDVEEGGQEEAAGEGEDGKKKEKKKKGGAWEYLLGMPLWSLTMERIKALEAELQHKQAEIDKLEDTAPEEMWEADLNAIEDALDEMEAHADAAAAEERRQRTLALKRAATFGTLGGGGKRGRGGGALGSKTALPQVSALPSLGGGDNAPSARALAEMQSRQLALSAAEFPGLFDELLPQGKRPAPAATLQKADSVEVIDDGSGAPGQTKRLRGSSSGTVCL
eukprot:TRINITY_DN24798_c0_g1_i1.p1 TRINITY_DN24798_c0_g1~~TRINITY_DN24798_c0_g1_i1.p1  ORF type:complete len:1288 (+),score=381.44 TRINITY_DN24798_c0_g1_i1:105-3968(+)